VLPGSKTADGSPFRVATSRCAVKVLSQSRLTGADDAREDKLVTRLRELRDSMYSNVYPPG